MEHFSREMNRFRVGSAPIILNWALTPQVRMPLRQPALAFAEIA
jgi:hypothetical protein